MPGYTEDEWDFEEGYSVEGGVIFEINSKGTTQPWKAIGFTTANTLGAGEVTPEEAEANARLMAAAPELMEACRATQLALRATSQKEKDYSYELSLLNGAIRKATGIATGEKCR